MALYLRNSFVLSVFLTLIVSLFIPHSSFAREEQKKLVIGVIPERNIFEQHKRYRILAEYISKKIGVEISVRIFKSYGEIIDSFESHKLDGAFFGSFTGALAHEKLKVDVLARPVTPDGKSTYRGYFIARIDSGIRSVEDMRGKIMAFVDKASSCGYIYPLAYLKENGVSNINTFFKEYFFTGGHDAVIHAVLEGTADVGVAKNTVYKSMFQKDPRVGKELIVLDESPEFPSHGLFVRSSLDPVLKHRLLETLLEMDIDPSGISVLKRFGAIKFIKAETHEDYKNVFETAKKAGIDLKTYNYHQ